MKILLVASEVSPFAKTGGLADVSSALPIALNEQGMDVRIVMPAYRSVNPVPSEIAVPAFNVKLGNTILSTTIYQSFLPNTRVPVYFIHTPELFHRDSLYQENGVDYPDNALRFAFLSKAALQMIGRLDWQPDIIHCNDWQTGPLPMMLRCMPEFANSPELKKIRTVFTIHNLGYQGIFPLDMIKELDLPEVTTRPDSMEFYNSINFLKGGLVYADKLTTVSPTYAQEIQGPDLGYGLEGVLKARAEDLTGILNGINYREWDPETDIYLPENYSTANLAGKAECKNRLQKELGLEIDTNAPLFVLISRLDSQKGIDILLPLVDIIIEKKGQLAILGTGRRNYEEAFLAVAHHYIGRMTCCFQFDNALAHRMEAGGDGFLMPSRYEPCGLNQMYSQRYGTLPIVRRTGGLADSVSNINIGQNTGTGFVFYEYTPGALLGAIEQAFNLYRNHPHIWRDAQVRGMTRDFSWQNSAKRYIDLYHQMMQTP